MPVADDRSQTRRRFRREVGVVFFVFCLFAINSRSIADDAIAAQHFHSEIEPILEKYCYSCHGYGEHKGGHAFDEFKSDAAIIANKQLWLAVLKNVRAGLMPPRGEDRPTVEEQQQLLNWIKFEAFGIDTADPDPGRVTLRRLNRVEYRNTIRDLMGIDYDTTDEFPADDSGYGFDNVGDALSLSPLLMEKYFNAAETIVAQTVPAKEVNARLVKQHKQYLRFFPNGPIPTEPEKRDAYAREVLSAFVRKAYRRPVDGGTVNRLVALAKAGYTTPGQTFEASIGRAMVAVLSSPRFLFRVEGVAPGTDSQRFPLIDEYALASRLSYFLWSTMPDQELTQLAERGELRGNLATQVDRMMKSPKSKALSDNFAGQWLRARDIETTEIEPISALGLGRELDRLQRELQEIRQEQKSSNEKVAKDKKAQDAKQGPRWQEREKIRAEHRRISGLAGMFNVDLRRAMHDETIAYFDYVARGNRDVIEFIDSRTSTIRHVGM